MSYTDVAVANIDELADGEMKQLSVAGKEILLARVSENFYAVGRHRRIDARGSHGSAR